VCYKYHQLIVRTLDVRSDLIFQMEVLIHNIPSSEVKYSLECDLASKAIKLFPLVFIEIKDFEETQTIEAKTEEEPQRVDVMGIDLSLKRIFAELKGHSEFKIDFKHNFLKFLFLNRMKERKILSIFLCGESGVGKTEFAKIITRALYPAEPLIKINFGNYSTEGVLNSLIGSPLGYLGSEEGGELINKISVSKSKIILIDEFEKATTSVFNFFYELLEDGIFTDRHGAAHNGTVKSFAQIGQQPW
jgi:ATP-dependent Clp protease ATP-binding subunit ClpC